jgi:glutamate-1-semialdehyde 2,1-aminomutase
VPLIFDEVITGFRWSKGGAQARYGIVPDLTLLAKILAGGLPGGAVAGARAILEQLDPNAARAAGREKIGHQGTFNANPISAAAAVATLTLVESSEACARAEAAAEVLRAGMRAILAEEDVPWGVFGEASVFVVFPNPAGLAIDPARFDPLGLGFKGLKGARDAQLNNRLRVALLAHGVDIAGGPGGFVSTAHGEREVAQTLEAFRAALRELKAEGAVR